MIHEELSIQIGNLNQLAYYYTRNSAEAQDLVQDTMVLALRFGNNYQDGTNLKAWLGRVMKNRHISITRRKSLEKRALEREGRHALKEWSISDMGKQTTRNNGGVENDHQLSDSILEALRGLRPEFQEAICLCDIDGLSYAEAAERVGCPVGTIMSRLHRGRRAMRKTLGSKSEALAAA